MRKNVLALTLAITLVFPQTLIAQGNCIIDALDSVAGLGTQITLSACPIGGTLSVVSPSGQKFAYDVKSPLTSIPAADLTEAGSYSVSIGASTASFNVLADAPDARTSRLSASTRMIAADGRDDTTITLLLQDRFGNPLTGRPVALLSNRTDDAIVPAGTETDSRGEMRWSVHTNIPGQVTLTAYDILSSTVVSERVTLTAGGGASTFAASVITSAQGGEFGVVDRFSVKILDEVVRANEDLSLRIEALDAAGNIVEDYTGTVELTSSDQEAVLPGRGVVTFRPAELGSKEISLGLRFRTPGDQTLTITDQSDSSIKGTTTVSVERISGQGSGEIQIIDPPDGARVSAPEILLQGKGPSLINVRVKGGAEEVSGETDAEGVFRITVPLNPAQTDHTLFVVSDNGRYESPAHHIVLDTSAPSVESITFTPDVGAAGTDATITVLSEPKLKSVTAEIGRQTLTLQETASGSYSATFTAPEPKSYDVKVTVTDGGGNAQDILAKWNVEGKGLPIVDGVKAEGRPNAVYVTWSAVDDPDVVQYRVYVGSSPTNYEYGLNTGSPVTSALVNGLTPGVTYYIAVTAIDKDNNESIEKSTPASASPLGMSMKVTPGNESLLIEWSPPANTPLATYILEYGVDAGSYSEKRKINGELRAYTVRDLINDVTYELKLTPVTITGQPIQELSTIAYGKPNGKGFGLGPADPTPFPIGTPDIVNPSNDPLHGGAPIKNLPDRVPSNTGSGIPPFALYGTLFAAFVLGIGVYRYRRQRALLLKFMAMMDQQYHSR